MNQDAYFSKYEIVTESDDDYSRDTLILEPYSQEIDILKWNTREMDTFLDLATKDTDFTFIYDNTKVIKLIRGRIMFDIYRYGKVLKTVTQKVSSSLLGRLSHLNESIKDYLLSRTF